MHHVYVPRSQQILIKGGNNKGGSVSSNSPTGHQLRLQGDWRHGRLLMGASLLSHLYPSGSAGQGGGGGTTVHRRTSGWESYVFAALAQTWSQPRFQMFYSVRWWLGEKTDLTLTGSSVASLSDSTSASATVSPPLAVPYAESGRKVSPASRLQLCFVYQAMSLLAPIHYNTPITALTYIYI